MVAEQIFHKKTAPVGNILLRVQMRVPAVDQISSVANRSVVLMADRHNTFQLLLLRVALT